MRDVGERIRSEMLKNRFASELNPNNAQFLRYDASGDVARIIYKRYVDGNSEWLAVMFHNEIGEWKIGRLVGYRHLGANVKDAEGISDLLEHIEARIE